MQKTLKMGAVIEGDGVVTNLEFHEQGQMLAMTTNSSVIHIIDAFTGEEKKRVHCKETGIGKIAYTHHDSSIITSACLRNCNDIRYHCLYDNRFIREFRGHSELISSISMNPTNDQFMSSSRDGTVCIWDLATPNPVAKIVLPPHSSNIFCSYDTAGIVFGVYCHDNSTKISHLKLFDARNFSQGPFENIYPNSKTMEKAIRHANPALKPSEVGRYASTQVTGFEFSADGAQKVLVNTCSDVVFVLDGFKSTVEPKVIMNRKNEESKPLGATFSADASQIIVANDDNEILFFDKTTLELKQTLTGHVAPAEVIRTNRVYDVMASGCCNTVLWIPSSV